MLPDPVCEQPQHPAVPGWEQQLLRDLRVVLVAPTTEANIGAAARCCANFEVPSLWLVAPRCEPRGEEVLKVACGTAVLDRMQVCFQTLACIYPTTCTLIPQPVFFRDIPIGKFLYAGKKARNK